MKKYISIALITALMFSCAEKTNTNSTVNDSNTEAGISGQDAVQDDVSQKDVVKVAVGSKDHSTLVAALKQAQYVDDLSNAGPFTVFAPTNAAFDALPEGTVDGLMKDDKKADLQNILEYHVALGVYNAEAFNEGQTLGMVNGGNITITKINDKVLINGKSSIVASIRASNGIIHVVDAVLLPPSK